MSAVSQFRAFNSRIYCREKILVIFARCWYKMLSQDISCDGGNDCETFSLL